MPLFQAERCRALAAECRQLASTAENTREKTMLTNLAFSWNRLANQTDRYVEYLKMLTSEKQGRVSGVKETAPARGRLGPSQLG